MKWNFWFNRSRWESRMEAEFQFHLQSQINDYVKQGLSQNEAEMRARREFGGLDLAKEECRDGRPLEWFDHLLREFHCASRSLKQSFGFTVAAVFTLAIAIGANTGIFSVLEGIVLAPLPYHDADRVVVVALYNRSLKYPTKTSYRDFLDWQQNSTSFEQIAALRAKGFDLSSPGLPQHLEGREVSSNFFSTLGAPLELGREISVDEDHLGGATTVVISDRLWRQRFGGSPNVLGKNITLDGVDYAIVGVTAPGYALENPPVDVYTAIEHWASSGGDNSFDPNDRTIHDILCFARLKPGVGVEQALAEMNTVQQHIDELHSDAERGQGAWVESLKHFIVGNIGSTLLLLWGAVGLLLLIACANVANLLLARSSTRTREFAVRLALGASRPQIVRQLIVESVLLSLTGGILGLALAKWGVQAVLRTVPESIPRVNNIGLNGTVLWFAFAVSMTVGIVFGLLPALQTSRLDLQAGLKHQARNGTARPRMTQRVLVIGQVALTLVLLVGGSLLSRTLLKLWAVNPGFDAQHVITFQVGLSPSVVKTADGTRNAYQQLVQRLQEIPGVESADITGLVPLSKARNEGPFWVGHHPPASMAEIPRAIYYPIGPDYFSTMKIPVIRGRSFATSDTADTELVGVIDDLLARTYFQTENPINQSITFPHWGAQRDVSVRIVGVVGHVEHYGLDGALGEKPQIYYSFYQLPDDAIPGFRSELRIAVRTALDSAPLMPAIQGVVDAAGGDQPVYNIETMQEFVMGSMGPQRVSTLLLLTFSLIALLLAAVGTYGVISYFTAQRVHEIGIRIAVGATRSDVLCLIIRQGGWLAASGVAIGISTALILGHILPSFSRLLYGIQPTDPVAIGGASVVLLTSAVAACYIPARRASRIDCIAALRQE